jgi:hypothetical protein
MKRYCPLCGNKQVTDDKPCAKCRAIVEGPLAEAYKRWLEAGNDFRMCCGGLSSAGRYLYFHGKYFDDVYPKVTRGRRKGQGVRRGPYVEVEHGIDFFADHAGTWYRHDTGNDVGSTPYGEDVPYADPEFWKKLEANFDHAAEAAFNDDWQTCRRCGNHFFESCGCEDES